MNKTYLVPLRAHSLAAGGQGTTVWSKRAVPEDTSAERLMLKPTTLLLDVQSLPKGLWDHGTDKGQACRVYVETLTGDHFRGGLRNGGSV
jgi:hypothetical protein